MVEQLTRNEQVAGSNPAFGSNLAVILMPHRILNLEEVSELLHLTVSEVRSLVKYDEIPHERHGDRIQFRKIEVDAWASQQLIGAKNKELESFHRRSSVAKQHNLESDHAIMGELVMPDCIAPDFHARTKDSVLRGLVSLAENSGYVYDPEDLLESLREREAMRSTALEMGVALVHPRHHDPYMFEDSLVALARVSHPIHFGAPDDQPTDLFFLICCQEDNIHLHTLARISMMCVHTDLLENLRAGETTMDLYTALQDAEAQVIKGL